MYLEDAFKEDSEYNTHFYISINSKNSELKNTKCGLYVSTNSQNELKNFFYYN